MQLIEPAMADNRTSIAIIGYGYRAPGVGRKGLWEYLAEAQSAWSDVPAERFDQKAYYHADPEKPGCYASRGGHFLPDDIFAFDAAFFQIRAEEARCMDPQHRLILECAFEAAEQAGVRLADLAGSNTGAFAANEKSEYWQQTLDDLPTTSKYTATSTAACMFANRMSYFFDLNGPSVSIDAACASGSSAIHLACQSVRSGECSTAFVGAASLILNPTMWSAFDTMGALSAEGKCFSYDPRGAGFGRGEGAGCLLIKRLDDALRDGDPIQAVIRNTAVNHGGRTDGITVPARSAQEALLRRVHEQVGLDPADTPVVEGHGTGTKVGDPIEANSIATVVGRRSTALSPTYLGSVKSNFGHTESTSGVLAVIKAVMMLQIGFILPNASATTGGLNAKIEQPEKLKIVSTLTQWPEGRHKRIVVSNFGFGGSNAAVLLEGSNRADSSFRRVLTPPGDSDHGRLFVFSAKSESSLAAYMLSFADYLRARPGSSPESLSYTLCQRRTHHAHRAAFVATLLEDLHKNMTSFSANGKSAKARSGSIAFVFTGQGAQHAQMGKELSRFPVFAAALADADRTLRSLGASWSLLAELDKPDHASRINEADYSQPACTAIQLALVKLLRSWNIRPTTVTGHSSGEIAAAFAAGFMSFRSALAIAFFRGYWALKVVNDPAVRGTMLALGASAEQARALINDSGSGYATIAATNSPASVTISGDCEKLDRIEAAAKMQGLFVRKLKVGVAYHSVHMSPVGQSYLESIKSYCEQDVGTTSTDSVAFVSSVTGRVESKATVNAHYWVKNLLQEVRFLSALETLFSPDAGRKYPDTIIEIGPHAALKGPIKQTLDAFRDEQQARVQYHPSLVRGELADEALLALAGHLFGVGVEIDFANVNLTTHTAVVLSDLPSYEWNHSVSYKHESRITKQKAHPGQPYRSFLGWKVPYSEGGEHSFRQVFTLDELPWLRDHNIAGDVIFPMTAYVTLAVTALEALLGPSTASSVAIGEFFAKQSLKIEEEERIDITTKLRPQLTGTESASSTNWTFEVLSWTETRGWTMHAQGHLEAGSNMSRIETHAVQTASYHVTGPHLVDGDFELEYERFKASGLCYGPTFRNMSRLWHIPGGTVHDIDLQHRSHTTLSSFEKGHTLAPLLDSLFHTFGVIQGMDGPRSTFVLSYFRRLRLLRTAEIANAQALRVVTQRLGHDSKLGSFTVSVVAFALVGHSWLPLCEFEHITGRSIAGPLEELSTDKLPDSYYTALVPHLDYMSSDEIAKVIAAPAVQDEELWHQRSLNDAAVFFLARALTETVGVDHTQWPSHLVKFRKWAEATIIQRLASGASFHMSAEAVDNVRSADAQGTMLCAIGDNLVPILRGEVEPLEIMLKDNLLSRNYEENAAGKRGADSLAVLVSHISDMKPRLRILEIGAGTASATVPVLEAMTRGGEALSIVSYTFTDLSTGFFEAARGKLEQWSSVMEYRKLDISEEPAAQGFAHGSYDLVIASNVLHATPNIAQTIDNVHSLLSPGGKLVMLECRSHPASILPFALLPGWWLAEDKYRTSSGPMLSEQAWDDLLIERHFSGVDIALPDYPDTADHHMNVICTTKIDETDDGSLQSITVCGDFVSPGDAVFAQEVADCISRELHCATHVKPYGEVVASIDKHCVFMDSKSSVFSKLSSTAFDQLRKVLLDTSSLVWVTPDTAQPDAHVAKGLLRTLRLEDSLKSFLLLEEVPASACGAAAVVTIVQRLQMSEATRLAEQEFVWNDGAIHVPRLRAMNSAKQTFARQTGVPARAKQNIWSSNVALEMTVDAVGSPDSIYFHRTEARNTQTLQEDHVIIQVSAAGVNFRDLLLVLGSMPWHAPGLEGAGVVTHVGSKVTDLQPGDRVFYISNMSGIATHVRIPAVCAHKIPTDLSLVDAATMPIAYTTALISLKQIGRLQQGESVLIHAASGAVGQASIAIAQLLGANIFVTAGTPEKRKFLEDTFDIPKDRIFSSRDATFRDSILRATNGAGVDLILNSLSGELLQATWELIADFGRFVEIGKKDLLQNTYLGMRHFDRNVTFSGIDLHKIFKKRPEAAKEHLSNIIELYRNGAITPIRPVTELPVSELATGLRKLQTGNNIGKIVITMNPDDEVLADLANPLGNPGDHVLRPDATYLITGGTGGIGRSMAAWMFENGARNVVLLGRSGASNPEVAALLKQYQGTDSHLRAIACNVGDRDDLTRALQSIRDLPRVSGVIHGALYLRDSILANATFDDWEKVTAPKIAAAWNLHELLPELDFFVSLASVTGVTGHAGQSIYGGTTTFLDSFTSYRRKLGLPAISISLPVIEDVGYVADRGLSAPLQRSLGVSLSVSHVQTLVKGAIIGSSSGLFHDNKTMSCIRGYDSTLPWDRFNMLSALSPASVSKEIPSCDTEATISRALDTEGGLLEALMAKICSMTMMEADEVSPERNLKDYGLDSLVSVELRNWIKREVGVDMAMTQILAAANLRSLVQHMLSAKGAAS